MSNGTEPILCQIAAAIGKRNIVKQRLIHGLLTTRFVYGLSDETTIVASRPIDKAFNHWEYHEESFEDVWNRLSIKDTPKEDVQ